MKRYTTVIIIGFRSKNVNNFLPYFWQKSHFLWYAQKEVVYYVQDLQKTEFHEPLMKSLFTIEYPFVKMFLRKILPLSFLQEKRFTY